MVLCANFGVKIWQMILSTADKTAMTTFYSGQKIRLQAELKHAESMLRKLKGENVDESTGAILTRTGEKARKRGPKSVWGKFILEQLDASNHPMRYNELIQRAMEDNNLEPSMHSKVRASILNSAFRLRSIQGRIATVGEKGKKDKFLVLKNWLNEKGEVRNSDHEWLLENHSFHALPVNLEELQSPRYEEDMP